MRLHESFIWQENLSFEGDQEGGDGEKWLCNNGLGEGGTSRVVKKNQVLGENVSMGTGFGVRGTGARKKGKKGGWEGR